MKRQIDKIEAYLLRRYPRGVLLQREVARETLKHIETVSWWRKKGVLRSLSVLDVAEFIVTYEFRDDRR